MENNKEKMYLVYRLRNSLFYRALHLARFLIIAVGNEGNQNQITNKIGLTLEKGSLLKSTLEPLKPYYKNHEINYYLVSEERFNDVKYYNQKAGTYPIIDTLSCLARITELDIQDAFITPPIKVRDLNHFAELKETYDIQNHDIDIDRVARVYGIKVKDDFLKEDSKYKPRPKTE